MFAWFNEHLNWLLVVLFAGHVLPFAWLSVRRRTWAYWSTLLTFALLVALNWMRALELAPRVMGVSVQGAVRACAIGFALITVGRFVRRRLHRGRE